MKLSAAIPIAASLYIGLMLGSSSVYTPQSQNKTAAPFDNSIADVAKPAPPIRHPAFMSPHASPIAIHGNHVYVVNTPADTLDVIDANSNKISHRVHVGVDPVSVAVRPDGKEVWVSNHVSDSVSVIDTNPGSATYLCVIDTIQHFNRWSRSTRFDEPVGIAFASNEKAYVALSSENEIAVIDVATREISKRLKIKAQDPRAILVRDERLYVIPFESNNQTQLSGGNKNDIDGELVTFDAWNHSVEVNNVLSIGHVVDIVKHPDVPDRDLFVYDTKTDKLIDVVDGLGTLLYGIAVDSNGRVFISQTDARNDANGRSGTKSHGLAELENRAFLNQITRVDLTAQPSAERIDLEPQLPAQPGANSALATPFAIQVSNDDQTLFATAAGSDKFFSVDAKTGEVVGAVEVQSVPRGIALQTVDGKTQRAWVFNAVENSVSLVDVTDPSRMSVVESLALEDPTDAAIKRGRKAFNLASASTSGTFSCASCHPDGHTDQLLWILKTPLVTGGDQIMPRSTMPIRGLRDTAPFHWDGIPGDPYGGNNSANVYGHVEPNCDINEPESAARHLIDGALASTMNAVDNVEENDEGKVGALSARQRDDMAKFLLAVPYPPAQRRAYTNVLSKRAMNGFELFHIRGDDDPTKINANVCGDCHRMPFWVSTNTPGTGMDTPTWRGANDRWLILPQGRLNIIEFDFFERVAKAGFDERQIWRFSWAGRPRFDPVWNMVLEGSTGYSGAFARQVTLNARTSELPETSDLLDALEQSANEGAIVLQVDAAFLADAPANRKVLRYSPEDGGKYHSSDGLPKTWTSRQLRKMSSNRQFIGTFTAHLSHAADCLEPQPALWTLGPIEQQRGHQEFPFLHTDNRRMTVSGRHIDRRAKLFVDGRLVKGKIAIKNETVHIELDELPKNGMHMLQVLNPNGLFSNDFIFHVADDEKAVARIKEKIESDRTDEGMMFFNAVSGGDLNQIQRMVVAGANVNQPHPENGSTALSVASVRGDSKVIDYLLSQNANVVQKNREGNTALHAAAFLCRFEIVETLLDKGAKIGTKNVKGETAIEVVSGKWTSDLDGFYRSLAAALEFPIDIERIKRDRPKMAEMLRNRMDQE